MNALLIFAEHRYYGESSPLPATSAEDSDPCQRFLTTEQAMADYAYLIAQLRADFSDTEAEIPFIGFGGSYGGMLGSG